MIKVCELVHRRADLSVEQFQAYWRTTHGPIVSCIPGIQRYVQSHPLPGGYRKGLLPYDGVAEIWVEDQDVWRRFPQHEAFHAAKRDEPNVIEISSRIELVVDEVIVIDAAAPANAIKSLSFVRFRDDLSVEEGQSYWRTTHGPSPPRFRGFAATSRITYASRPTWMGNVLRGTVSRSPGSIPRMRCGPLPGPKPTVARGRMNRTLSWPETCRRFSPRR